MVSQNIINSLTDTSKYFLKPLWTSFELGCAAAVTKNVLSSLMEVHIFVRNLNHLPEASRETRLREGEEHCRKPLLKVLWTLWGVALSLVWKRSLAQGGADPVLNNSWRAFIPLLCAQGWSRLFLLCALRSFRAACFVTYPFAVYSWPAPSVSPRGSSLAGTLLPWQDRCEMDFCVLNLDYSNQQFLSTFLPGGSCAKSHHKQQKERPKAACFGSIC